MRQTTGVCRCRDILAGPMLSGTLRPRLPARLRQHTKEAGVYDEVNCVPSALPTGAV